jgi:hypothetical protein
MSFNINRQSDGRQVKTDISGFGDDDINVSRDPFKMENTNLPDELGMDFLVDKTPEAGGFEAEEDDDEEDEYDEDGPDLFQTNTQQDSSYQTPQRSYEDIQQEKAYLISQLKRLEKKGSVLTRRFTMEHSLEEIRGEVFRIKKEESMDAGIDYCRQGLMFCVSSIEMAEGKYNNGEFLGGWSRNVMGNIDSYDGVFEELYEKYYTTATVAPEIKLISMLAGSGFMFSLQKKMLTGTSIPPKQREMSGPSIDTDDLMRRLNEIEVDEDDDIASIASNNSSIKIKEAETKTINVKKPRGRPKK